eukprot:c5940_g1_i1.p1 GENE.c5940_g1_i1~~c5940_g1_i1.p1  ORF type:complete len:160 (-),score=29.54 c5940_g1_i1:3-482(-)
MQEFVFFWKPTEENGEFSQWYESQFTENGITYNTAEQYMMYQKAVLFHDPDVAQQILDTNDPKQQKKLGRLVSGFVEDVWNTKRTEIVVAANMAKFSQNEQLKQLLLSTGEKVLVEASPLDNIWGIGMSKTHANSRIPEKWRGLNLLGNALMIVRSKLR